jgi:hypothetical protein
LQVVVVLPVVLALLKLAVVVEPVVSGQMFLASPLAEELRRKLLLLRILDRIT